MPDDLHHVSQDTTIQHCPEICKEDIYEVVKMTESDLNTEAIGRTLASQAASGMEYDLRPEYAG